MKRIFLTILAVILMLSLIPVATFAANGDGNFGFIPNSGEASVSKVDLVSDNAVARYWTAPRYGQEVDAVGNPTPGVPFNVPPYGWRTSRIAMDVGGNAWVINVGADAFLNSYPNEIPDFGGGYRAYDAANIAAYGLVGSIVRIQADTEGLGSTNNDHSLPLTFGTDDAVQVFPVGEKGDMPRAIAFDANGDVWVGFYGGKYFQKYSYNGTALDPVGDNITGNFSPYQAAVDKNGILWFSSRNSNPGVPADRGIYYFDTQAPGPPTRIDLGVNPYAILIDNSGADVVVWATAYGGSLYKIDTAGGEPYSATEIAITGANQLRGMSFDNAGVIWIASTANDAVSWYNPANGTSGPIAAGATPVGVGNDAAGYMWAICRDDANDPGFIAKFDPANLGAGFTQVAVGFRPYAYGQFIIQPELECFDETVWAAQANPGETRFVDQGDWGTYFTYPKDSGNATDPAMYPLFAGQTHLAGWLHVYNDGNTLWVKYVASEEDGFMEGYTGDWSGLSEYHLHVGDDLGDFDEVRTWDNKAGMPKNPIPGQFAYTHEYDEPVLDTGWIEVDIENFGDPVYIAAHGVMWWCGYPD
jgi:hypothetical protein